MLRKIDPRGLGGVHRKVEDGAGAPLGQVEKSCFTLIFVENIDAAAVYVNASTRFTDGEEFGFGAEIGISTQKLHVRGPMGLVALTTTKYIVRGNGQVRQ